MARDGFFKMTKHERMNQAVKVWIHLLRKGMSELMRPKVGVGVIVVRDGRVLLGRRKGAHGDGYWAFPGGHLEFGESIEECAKREVLEESGISIRNIRKVTYTNDIFPEEGKHYVTCYVRADYDSGDVRTVEPDKCDGWEWFEWNAFPDPLFIPLRNLLRENVDVRAIM